MKTLESLSLTAILTVIISLICGQAELNAQFYCGSDPVAVHGALSVNGNRIVDQNGDVVSFAGNSMFWSNSGFGGEGFYSSGVVSWLEQDWGATIVRAAMGVDEFGGYLSDPQNNMNRVKTIVDAAIDNGLYVIIDWHTHHAEDHQAAAISFFQEMAQTYGNHPNVIYEIYNEPLQVSWSNTIKPYAEAVINAIRAIDPDNLIIVGSSNWSQDVDIASNNPITGQSNIAYTLHFYAATHGAYYRQKAQTALDNGIALMVTEWGSVSANGDGAVDHASTETWMNFLQANDISHLNWAINDKVEGASALFPGASHNGGWLASDLTPSGINSKNIVENWPEYCSDGSNNSPIVSLTNPANNSNFDEGTAVLISADAVDSDGSISLVEFFANGTNVGADQSAPYFVSWVPASAGNYQITAVATDDEGETTTSTAVAVTIGDVTLAYPDGVPHSIPGLVNATHYDTGGAGVSYFDTDAGNNGDGPRPNEDVDTELLIATGNVGYIEAGEWLDFTVNVETSGLYEITYQVASEQTGLFRLEFDGQDVTGNIFVASTGGWGNFVTLTSQDVALTSGQQTMRVYFVEGPFNIADITLELQTVAATGVSVDPTSMTLEVGATATIVATVAPANATEQTVTWSSSDSSIATVDSSGVVTAASEGSATITATTVDGGFTATTEVTVETSMPCDFALGDINRDGTINLLDVNPFIDLLGSSTFQCEGDTNGDGSINLLDVNPFIDLLGGG